MPKLKSPGAKTTAKCLAGLKPKTARIYPTIVLEGTYLAELYEEGKYVPQTEALSMEKLLQKTNMFVTALLQKEFFLGKQLKLKFHLKKAARDTL